MSEQTTGVDDTWRYAALKDTIAKTLERDRARVGESAYTAGRISALEQLSAFIEGLESDVS